MKRKMALVGTAALLLAGCASINHGTVTGKEYDDPDVWTSGGYMSGKVFIPLTVHNDPECWRILLAEGDDTGSICVSEQDYERIRVGDYIPPTEK